MQSKKLCFHINQWGSLAWCEMETDSHLLRKLNTCPISGHLWLIISSWWPVPKQSNWWTCIQLSLVSQNLLSFSQTDWMEKGWNIAFLLQMIHPLCSAVMLPFCSWFTSYFPEIIFMEAQYSILNFIVPANAGVLPCLAHCTEEHPIIKEVQVSVGCLRPSILTDISCPFPKPLSVLVQKQRQKNVVPRQLLSKPPWS